MKKLLLLLVCTSLSICNVARATKLAHIFAPESAGKAVVNDADTDEGTASDDDDSVDGASNGDGEDLNDDDGGDAAGDEDTGDDDADNDDGGDDGSGNQGK
jgi:hypothetical protein